jgi:hypothetical protein
VVQTAAGEMFRIPAGAGYDIIELPVKGIGRA